MSDARIPVFQHPDLISVKHADVMILLLGNMSIKC